MCVRCFQVGERAVKRTKFSVSSQLPIALVPPIKLREHNLKRPPARRGWNPIYRALFLLVRYLAGILCSPVADVRLADELLVMGTIMQPSKLLNYYSAAARW